MATQEFNIHTKYTNTGEDIAFGLSIPFVCILSIIFFGQYDNFLLSFALNAALAVTISASNILLLVNLPKLYKFKNLSQRITTHGVVFIVLAISAVVAFANVSASFQPASASEVLKEASVTGFLASLANAVFALIYYIRLWQKNVLFTEALKREIMHTQLEGIRQQLSPHFFFNSLNSLTLVIEDNPKEAVTYVHHIAHMYRYLLQSKETKAVPLLNELRFAESYIYLQKMRFGKALDMSINIDKSDRLTVIPPLTLYILLENALKHNIITKAKPLHINVFIKDGKLQISNNIQARQLPDENPVIGLRTVRSSYESISVQPLQIIQDDDNFTVALPLIKELSQTA